MAKDPLLSPQSSLLPHLAAPTTFATNLPSLSLTAPLQLISPHSFLLEAYFGTPCPLQSLLALHCPALLTPLISTLLLIVSLLVYIPSCCTFHRKLTHLSFLSVPCIYIHCPLPGFHDLTKLSSSIFSRHVFFLPFFL